jgi:hypothetical protein
MDYVAKFDALPEADRALMRDPAAELEELVDVR